MLGSTHHYIIKINVSTGSVQDKFQLDNMSASVYVLFKQKFISDSLMSLIYIDDQGAQVVFVDVETREVTKYEQQMSHSIYFTNSIIYDDTNEALWLGGYDDGDYAQVVSSNYKYLHTMGEVFALDDSDTTVVASSLGSSMSFSSYSHSYGSQSTYTNDGVTGASIEGVDATLTISSDLNFTYLQIVNVYDSALDYSTKLKTGDFDVGYNCYEDVGGDVTRTFTPTDIVLTYSDSSAIESWMVYDSDTSVLTYTQGSTGTYAMVHTVSYSGDYGDWTYDRDVNFKIQSSGSQMCSGMSDAGCIVLIIFIILIVIAIIVAVIFLIIYFLGKSKAQPTQTQDPEKKETSKSIIIGPNDVVLELPSIDDESANMM